MMKQMARATRAARSARAPRILGGAGAGVVAGLVFAGVVAGSVAAVPDALAQEAAPGEVPSKASCAQAYESSQESRASGQLQETQKRLSVCARAECPSFVQKDCARWLEEVDRELPSVTLRAEGLDAEAARLVRVTLDGQPVPNALGGAPIALDPGRHELVAESPGRSRIARTIVAQQGVQGRPISLDFAPEPAPASAEAAVDTGSPGSSLRPYAYVAWGLGAVGLGTFAVLGTLGRADERALKDDCPSATEVAELVMPGVCAASEADERKQIYEREFVLADIGLVTGIMGAAAGTVLFILAATDGSSSSADGSSSAAGLHLDVAPAPGGGYASVGGVF
jgi:hypothetical protein